MYSIHAFLLQKELFRSPEPVKTTVVSSFTDTPALQQIARQADSDYILFYTGTSPIELHPYAIGRMYQIAESSDGALFYSDYQEIRQGKKIYHPTLEYQTGSIRNDFDFGQLLLFRNDSFQQVVAQMNTDYRFAALYELRLSISRLGKIVHIPETPPICGYPVKNSSIMSIRPTGKYSWRWKPFVQPTSRRSEPG